MYTYDPLDMIDEKERMGLVSSLKYWMMFDLFMKQATGTKVNECEIMMRNLRKTYPAEVTGKIFERAWRSMGSEFLNQYQIESDYMFT